MANTFDVSTSNLDSTFLVETSEEVKQPKKENESPKMLDSNNNPPKVLATKSNLPVPTMRVLRSTPKKNISWCFILFPRLPEMSNFAHRNSFFMSHVISLWLVIYKSLRAVGK